jgi:3-oxoacyl-[acyl-carrier protein] reductase
LDLKLKGKKALVTGGSRGIGRAICEALARDGADVATCARGQASLDETVRALREFGGDVRGAAVDVRDPDALAGWVDGAVQSLGGVDILVSNVSTRVDTSSPNWWRDTFEADLMQHVRLKTLALPHFEKRRSGSMLFVASIAATLTIVPPHEEAYGAMKASLVSLVGQWASALGPKGIRVNAISPGPIDFPGGWWDHVRESNPAAHSYAAGLSALGRMGTPEEVANAAAFLASPAAAYVTGANLRIDGGLLKTANF